MQHFEHLRNILVHLMVSNDHDERARGALAVTLVVVLTHKKRRRARPLAEGALVLDVLC